MSLFMKRFVKNFAKMKNPGNVPGLFDPEKDKLPEGAIVLGEMSDELKRDFGVLAMHRLDMVEMRDKGNAELQRIFEGEKTPEAEARVAEIREEFEATKREHDLLYHIFWHDVREEFDAHDDREIGIAENFIVYVQPEDDHVCDCDNCDSLEFCATGQSRKQKGKGRRPGIQIVSGSGAADLLAAIFGSAGRT